MVKEEKYDIKGHTGILLEKLVIKFDKVLGDHFEINLLDKEDIIRENGVLKNPYSTVIIGSNGTGKSYLLKTLADILLQIEAIEKNEKVKYTDTIFELSFFNHGEHFVVKNFTNESLKLAKRKKVDYICLENGTETTKPFAPSRILVSSVLLTDRFTIYSKPSESYKYLGVRNLKSPSSAGTRNYVKRTVEHVVNALSELETEFIYKLESLLKFLKFKNTFVVYYSPKYKDKFFDIDLTDVKFKMLFENYRDPEKGFSKRTESDRVPNNIQYYKKNIADKPELISEIVNFLIELRKFHLKTYGKSKVEYFEFDVIKRELSLDKFALIKELQALDLISYPSISLIKADGSIDLEETSSGEYHFISTMIGLFASIKQNSVILIDEPEVSLHPNWQMKYIHYLKDIFKEYSSSHFILTTHSHFVVSDLQGNTSFISGLVKKDGLISSFPINQNTYGWSAEEVLYSVFNVASVRNHFLEADIADLLGIISNNIKDTERINLIVGRLEALNITENDPLKLIIEDAKNYITNYDNSNNQNL